MGSARACGEDASGIGVASPALPPAHVCGMACMLTAFSPVCLNLLPRRVEIEVVVNDPARALALPQAGIDQRRDGLSACRCGRQTCSYERFRDAPVGEIMPAVGHREQMQPERRTGCLPRLLHLRVRAKVIINP